MTANRRVFVVVALVVTFAGVACGGGGSSTPSSSPTSPTPSSTPTPPPSTAPTSVTVYASNDNRVATATSDPKAIDTVVQGGIIGAGWQSNEYGTVGTGTVFKFDLPSQVTGRTISKATLRLSVNGPPREFPTTPQLRLSAFAADWSPSAITWNICTALACHAAGEALVPAPTANGPLDFDVTTIVANWASGAWHNYGLKLMVDQPAPGMMGRIATTWFYSLEYNNTADERPKLIIEYQ
jgi:hypothetical protein